MRSLFDFDTERPTPPDTTLDSPPDLSGVPSVVVNFECTGLRWWGGDHPIGINIFVPGVGARYLPFGHYGGGNLDEAVVYRWAQEQLKHKHIVNTNTRFDIHMARVWGERMGGGGLDLEAKGNTFGDVAHQAALLDDHRMTFRLDDLIEDTLGETPMARVDESRMASYPSWEVAPRARYGVDATWRLAQAFAPHLAEQDLMPVKRLEEAVIPVVVEMEKNGSPIDVDLLDRWLVESQKRLEGYLWSIARTLGWACNPDSPKQMARAWKQLGLTFHYTPTGAPSFTDEILSGVIGLPVVAEMRRAIKLSSLRSKFLVATKECMDRSTGLLHYALHQLRATKDEDSGGEAGTVTGRFSSSALERARFGVNIQQRIKAAKQRTTLGYDEKDTSHDDEIFIVRKLHIASKGHVVLASDMDQAQYRIFASYAGNPKIIEAYRQNPNLSFHKFMHEIVKPYADLTYRQQKDTNFAYLFGAGLVKMALMLHHITKEEFDDIRRTKDYDHPKLDKTKEVREIYEREVPEVKGLLEDASHLAKPACDRDCRKSNGPHRRGLPHRGYVKDAIGRRMRFPDGQRLHKAFNGVDQMTEASYMKTKLVELHKVRKETGLILRITNHDEIVADILDKHHADKVDQLLNKQSFPSLLVPLTWSTGIGPNWAETK